MIRNDDWQKRSDALGYLEACMAQTEALKFTVQDYKNFDDTGVCDRVLDALEYVDKYLAKASELISDQVEKDSMERWWKR